MNAPEKLFHALLGLVAPGPRRHSRLWHRDLRKCLVSPTLRNSVFPPDHSVIREEFPAPPQALFTRIHRNSTRCWIGENGFTYGVQTNGDLADGTWDFHTANIAGDGEPITFTNVIDEAPMFFRIVAE